MALVHATRVVALALRIWTGWLISWPADLFEWATTDRSRRTPMGGWRKCAVLIVLIVPLAAGCGANYSCHFRIGIWGWRLSCDPAGGGSPPYIPPGDGESNTTFDPCACKTTFSATAGGWADSSDRVVWAALVSNGQLLRHSAGLLVPNGGFEDVHLSVEVPPGSVPDGDYDFLVVASAGMGSVGNLTSYLATSNPVRVRVRSLGCSPSPGCLYVLYGDTLKLKANAVGGKLMISRRDSTESGDPGITWTALNAGPGGLDFFVDLLNGNFYPLKPNDGALYKWRVRAEKAGYATAEGPVMVDANVTLGTTNTVFDDQIIAWAQEHGIPPTISKAQIYREDATFNPRAYRYEPHFDSSTVTFNRTRYYPGTILTTSPYSEYRLAVPSTMPPLYIVLNEGRHLSVNDKSFRDIYNLVDDNGDQFYSAMELIRHNDDWGVLRGGPDFVAQTPLAASYGLKQVLYTTAVNPMNWNNGAGGPPTGLTDASVNLNISSAYLRAKFEGNDSIPDWTRRWWKSLRDYNGTDSAATRKYADTIMYYLVPLCRPDSGR